MLKCARVRPQLSCHTAPSDPALLASPVWTGVRAVTLCTPDACPCPPGLAIPSPTAGKRSSSSAQGSAWRVELGERFTAGEPRGDCVGLSIPRPWLAPAAALGGVPPEAAAPAPAPAGPPTLLLQAGDELQLLLLVRAVHFGGWGWG